jgi:hypothetical protein
MRAIALIAIAVLTACSDAKLHTQWPGGGIAGDETFDQFFASQVEDMADLAAIVGAPDWFKDGPMGRTWGITRNALTFSPVVHDPEQLHITQQAAPSGRDLVRCWLPRFSTAGHASISSNPV